MAQDELIFSGKLSQAELEKAEQEIANRPRAIPLDQRRYPYGKPQWLLDKEAKNKV